MSKSKINAAIFFSMIIYSFATQGQQDSENPLRRQVLYAPYRENYDINARKKSKNEIPPKKTACVFCKSMNIGPERESLILTKFEHNVVFLNLYPYQRGHLLVIPIAHVANLADLSEPARHELMELITAIPKIFETILGAQGTNIGINIGTIAGASKPDHIHIHALPRFKTDHPTFIQNVCETQVIQYDLNKLYELLKPSFDELKEHFTRYTN
ncbi:HIT domain-containing protein [bacterium]|nr:HIT domain-containing protein [bacterium]